MKHQLVKMSSTLVLKVAICLFGLFVLLMCLLLFPHIGPNILAKYPFIPYIPLALTGLYASAIPFFFALYKAYTLLTLIDNNNVFSNKAVKALRYFKYATFCMTFFNTFGLPLVFTINQHVDPPGLPLLATGFILTPSLIGIFAGVVEGVLQNAIDIKSENDLTV